MLQRKERQLKKKKVTNGCPQKQTMCCGISYLWQRILAESGWKNQHTDVNGSLSTETRLTLALFHQKKKYIYIPSSKWGVQGKSRTRPVSVKCTSLNKRTLRHEDTQGRVLSKWKTCTTADFHTALFSSVQKSLLTNDSYWNSHVIHYRIRSIS